MGKKVVAKRTEPIKRRKLSQAVKDRLLKEIESGEIKPGDQMPSENELMERYQVGRPAVREAMQALENMGLLTIHHGARAIVRSPSAEDIIKQLESATRYHLMRSHNNIQQLREARQAFEMGAAMIACQKASPEEVAELGMQLKKMQDDIGDPKKFRQADVDFHVMIADMSRNAIIAAVSRAMLKWLAEYHEGMLARPGFEKLTLEEHKRILKRLKARDTEGVARAVGNHLSRVNTFYQNNYSTQK